MTTMRATHTASALVFGLAAAALPAQQILQNFYPADYDRYFAPMGDLDGDGYEDLVLRAQIYVGPYPAIWDHELRFYSGRDGSLLRLGPRWAHPDWAACWATGDHDHDDVRDYICLDNDHSNATRRLSVRSGVDDRILWSVQAPYNVYWVYDVIGDIDVNGDGELDVIVSHPVGSSNQGDLWAYDHQGNLLYHKIGTGMINSLAQSLAKLGDINGDGCDEYITGLGDPTWYGAVAIHNGPDGEILRVVTGQNQGDYIGSGCTGCGDLDGDGLPDFAAGGGLSGSPGSVQAFSSATGARLFTVYSGFVGDHFGAVLRATDYDLDGVDDIVAAGFGGMRVVSGRDARVIAHYLPDSTASWATFEAQPLRHDEGFPHLLVRTQVLGTYLMTSRPRHSKMLGSGCTNVVPAGTSALLGMRELDGDSADAGRRLTLSGAAPGTPTFLLLGFADDYTGPQSLAVIGMPQCSLFPSVTVIGSFVTGTTGIDRGFAHHDFTQASTAALGVAIDAQWLTVDASLSPAGLSNALRFVVPP
jgi:hypothetical protein